MDASREAENVLEMERIGKRFGQVWVLKNVSVRVRRGSIHAIVGHNGAGKSTLMKIALGAERPTEGEVRVAGHELTYSRPAEARTLGLGMVMQERSLIRTLSGLDNLYLNSERKSALGLVDVRKQRAEIAGLLEELAIPRALLSTMTSDMSTIEQELIEIARALRLGSQVLILDEPTAPLGPGRDHETVRRPQDDRRAGRGNRHHHPPSGGSLRRERHGDLPARGPGRAPDRNKGHQHGRPHLGDAWPPSVGGGAPAGARQQAS